jgi:CheY-like chemotaxis protein
MSNVKPTCVEPRSGGGPLIYIVDDEPMVLELAAVILEPLGYTIATFRAPENALQAFRAAESPPVLLVTDYAMHAMNGLELIVACREIRPEQKVLLISGTVGQEVFRDAPVKPNRFLAKPFQSKQLAEAVAETMAG